jgi:hypothetical protein
LIADLAKAQGSVTPDQEFTVDIAQAEFWFFSNNALVMREKKQSPGVKAL